MTNFVATANKIKAFVQAAVTGLMIYALYVSMSHITHVARWAGVPGWEAATAFLLVDMPALIGKLLQLRYFAHTTRKAGRQMTYVSGSISLACNIFSGILHGSPGAAVWGAFVVGMFLYLESKLAKIKPAAAVTRAKNAAADSDEDAPVIVRTNAVTTARGTSAASERVRELLRLNPDMRVPELAERAGVSRSTARKVYNAMALVSDVDDALGVAPQSPAPIGR